MPEVFTFTGTTKYWIYGDRVSVSLEGASLPRALRLSTLADGETGRHLIRDMAFQRIEALNKRGRRVAVQNQDPFHLIFNSIGGPVQMDGIGGELRMRADTSDNEMADSLYTARTIATDLGWDLDRLHSLNARAQAILGLLAHPDIDYEGRGEFSLPSVSYVGLFTTIKDGENAEESFYLAISVETKEELEILQTKVGPILPLLIDATGCDWAHEDYDLDDGTSIVIEDETSIYLRSAAGSMSAKIEGRTGIRHNHFEISDVTGDGNEAHLLARLAALAKASGSGDVYSLPQQAEDFDLDSWLAEMAELSGAPDRSDVVHARIQQLLAARTQNP